MKNPFRDLSKFEKMLWSVSVVVVSISFLWSPERDSLNYLASLIGVTALIFVAKGYVIGQILTVIFSLFYGFISFYFQYYGEMITYLGMTAPMAMASVVSWLKHPYEKTKEVTVNHLSKRTIVVLCLLTILVTGVFYFILKALHNANLVVSTISVATSFFAASLVYLRSAYYGIAYGLNDLVLIVLWLLACLTDSSYIPMVLCFTMFFVNDVYGFINWRRIAKRQKDIH